MGFVGSDSFTFTVTDRGDPDGTAGNVATSAPGNVSITVLEANHAPVILPVEDQTVRVTDNGNPALSSTESFTITVNNVAPTLLISGLSNVKEEQVYTLNLSATDPGDDTISSWTIDWGDGEETTVTEFEGNPFSVEHTYTAPLPLPGDSDGDGDVDGMDALRFVLKYRRGEADQNDLHQSHRRLAGQDLCAAGLRAGGELGVENRIQTL